MTKQEFVQFASELCHSAKIKVISFEKYLLLENDDFYVLWKLRSKMSREALQVFASAIGELVANQRDEDYLQKTYSRDGIADFYSKEIYAKFSLEKLKQFEHNISSPSALRDVIVNQKNAWLKNCFDDESLKTLVGDRLLFARFSKNVLYVSFIYYDANIGDDCVNSTSEFVFVNENAQIAFIKRRFFQNRVECYDDFLSKNASPLVLHIVQSQPIMNESSKKFKNVKFNNLSLIRGSVETIKVVDGQAVSDPIVFFNATFENQQTFEQFIDSFDFEKIDILSILND